MAVVLQLPLCLYELQRLVISVDDCLLSQNVMFPLTIDLHNGILSLLYVGYFRTVSESVSLWYATRWSWWVRIVPTTYSDASVSISNSCYRSGKESTGVEHMWFFRSSNARCCAFPHVNFSLPPPLVTWLRVHPIRENPNMNLQYKLASPKKL